MTHDFICPVCASPFVRSEKTLRCAQGHSFDIAKQGYVNLLPSGRIAGHDHGDNREMIRARRDFLNAGHYAPLASRLSEIFGEITPSGGCILDCGCGEGYYSAYIAAALASREIDVLATDISRDAVSYAARRGEIRCAVANSFHLPLKDRSMHAVLSLCAPIAPQEFSRVLTPSGALVAVIPAERHLWAMKSAVYENPYENRPEATLDGLFTIESQEILRFDVHLESTKEIRDLFSMTPYAYHTNVEDRARLEKLESLYDTAEFMILVCRKA